MAVTTYIPRILFMFNFLKKYVNAHAPTLTKYLGEGGMAALTLVIDLCIIVAEMMDAGHVAGDAWSDFTKVNTLTSTQINKIQGAYDKFLASINVTP